MCKTCFLAKHILSALTVSIKLEVNVVSVLCGLCLKFIETTFGKDRLCDFPNVILSDCIAIVIAGMISLQGNKEFVELGNNIFVIGNTCSFNESCVSHDTYCCKNREYRNYNQQLRESKTSLFVVFHYFSPP